MTREYVHDLTLRTATAADAREIGELTREAYAKWVPLIGREPVPMAADYEAAVRQHRFGLLHQGDTLVALIEMIPLADHLLIENVAVQPGLQGKGIGLRLLAHAESVAIELGLPTIRLYTNARFAENVGFYERRGFRVDREESFRGGITVHMVKQIG